MLVGYCPDCLDDGVKTSTLSTSPANFGFYNMLGYPAVGQAWYLICWPNSSDTPNNIMLTGSGMIPGPAAPVSSSPWISGTLGAYLGVSAAPAQPIDAYLPWTQALDAGVTGFFVFRLQQSYAEIESAPGFNPLLTIGTPLPLGSWIVAMLNEGGPEWMGTKISGSIFIDGTPIAASADTTRAIIIA